PPRWPHASPIQQFGCLYYIVLLLSVCLKALVSSGRGTVEDFFLAGRKLAWLPIGASLFAANMGSGRLMSLARKGAMSGIAVGAFEWNAPLFLCVLGWIFSPIYIKAGVVTMPEYLRKRFGGYRIQFLLAVLSLFLYIFGDILVEICTGAMFMKLIWGFDVYLVTTVLLTITSIYTITGEATLTTEVFILTQKLSFKEVGGYQELLHKYLDAKPRITQEGNWTANPECYIPRLDSFHIFRDPITGDLPWPGIVFGVSILSLSYWLTAVGAGDCGPLSQILELSGQRVGVTHLFADQVACVVPSECKKHCGTRTDCSPIAYPVLVVELLPDGVRGLMLSAISASLMSSLTSIFNSANTLFTMDIYTRIRPMATEKELMVTGRFFVIILLVVTIAWVPVTETAHSEELFEYMQAVMSYLTPPIAAIFLLAVFSKRVTEQGAFWGLTGGLLLGFFRMILEFIYGTWSCPANNKCPLIICSLHYLYFAISLFVVSLLTMLAISLFTDPIPDKHLHRLCWSLRNSQEKRVDLDQYLLPEIRGFLPSSGEEQLGRFRGAWDVFCGLEPQPGPKLAPKEWEGTKRCDTSQTPFWRKVANISAFFLIVIVILCHIYYS
uniref:Sodium/myo-inositol cotransporter 2 n=1 Tax=Equus asinus asinus TaxID=83772 RepID=A0A8C4MM28_EQUAS